MSTTSSRPSSASAALRRALRQIEDSVVVGGETADTSATQPVAQVSHNQSADALMLATAPPFTGISTTAGRRAALERRKVLREWDASETRHRTATHPAFVGIFGSIPDSPGLPRRAHVSECMFIHGITGNDLIDLTTDDVVKHFGIKQLGPAKSVIRGIATLLDPSVPLDASNVDVGSAALRTSGSGIPTPAVDEELEVPVTRVSGVNEDGTTARPPGDDTTAFSTYATPLKEVQRVSRIVCAALRPHAGWEVQLETAQTRRQHPRPGSGTHRLQQALATRQRRLMEIEPMPRRPATAEPTETPPLLPPGGDGLQDTSAPLNEVSDTLPIREKATAWVSDDPSTPLERAVTVDPLTAKTAGYRPGMLETERRRRELAELHTFLLQLLPDGVPLTWLMETVGQHLDWDHKAVAGMTEFHHKMVVQERKTARRRRRQERKEAAKAARRAADEARGVVESKPDKLMITDGREGDIADDNESDGDIDAALEEALANRPAARPATNRPTSVSSISTTSRPSSALRRPNSRPTSANRHVSIVEGPGTLRREDPATPDASPIREAGEEASPSGNSTRGSLSAADELKAMILSSDEFVLVMMSVVATRRPPEFDHLLKYMAELYGPEKIELVRRHTASRQLFHKWCAGIQSHDGTIPPSLFVEVVLAYRAAEAAELTGDGTATPILLPDDGLVPNDDPLLILPKLGVKPDRPESMSRRGKLAAMGFSTSASLAASRAAASRTSPARSRNNRSDSTFEPPQPVLLDEEHVSGYFLEQLCDESAEGFDESMLRLRSVVDAQAAQRAGFGTARVPTAILTERYVARATSDRPLVLMHSSVIDPAPTVERLFRAALKRANVGGLADGRVPAPPEDQDRIHIFSIGGDTSEEDALRCIANRGMLKGHWIYISFPPETVDRPVDVTSTSIVSALGTTGIHSHGDEIGFGLPLMDATPSNSATSTPRSVRTPADSSSVIDSSASTVAAASAWNGRMNAFLRRVAFAVNDVPSYRRHPSCRILCHVPLDFIDPANIPQVARSVGVVAPLLVKQVGGDSSLLQRRESSAAEGVLKSQEDAANVDDQQSDGANEGTANVPDEQDQPAKDPVAPTEETKEDRPAAENESLVLVAGGFEITPPGAVDDADWPNYSELQAVSPERARQMAAEQEQQEELGPVEDSAEQAPADQSEAEAPETSEGQADAPEGDTEPQKEQDKPNAAEESQVVESTSPPEEPAGDTNDAPQSGDETAEKPAQDASTAEKGEQEPVVSS